MRRAEKFAHSLGLGSLFACVSLAFIVVLHMVFQGYFLGVEKNSVVLTLELALLPVSATYFVFLWHQKIKELKK